MAQIWSEVLGLPQVGRDDDFFALGGVSLTAIEMLMRTRSAFGIEIPMDAFFRSSTLRETSEIIEERLVAEIASLSDEEVAQLLGSS